MIRSALIQRWLAGLLLATLLGCASYSGRGLREGVAGFDEVRAVMGEPALRWSEPDGSVQLAYPRGPEGTHTFMVFLGPDGKLQRIVNVLEEKTFARVAIGSSQDDVLKLIGPPAAHQTLFFKARNVLVWEWLYCDGFSTQAWFGVEFDGMTGPVVKTYSRPDYRGWDGVAPTCGRFVQHDR